jgi:hypothetical protein
MMRLLTGVHRVFCTTKGFKIKMNEVVVDKSGAHNALSDGIHAEETIGWIAFKA